MSSIRLRKAWLAMLVNRLMAVAEVETPSALAERMKLHPQTLLDWWSGDRDPDEWKLAQWKRVADFAGVDYIELIRECDRYSGGKRRSQ